jgi:hypothetical protein
MTERMIADVAAHADHRVYPHLVRPLVDALGEAPGGPWWDGGAPAGPILDLAAQGGDLSEWLPDAVVVDPWCERLAGASAPRRVCADPEYLPFGADAFGAAVTAFGLTSCPHPERLAAELARVAPTVAALTWARPDTPYPPKKAVARVLARYAAPDRRTELLVNRLSDRVGHPFVLRDLLVAAGLRTRARNVSVEVPWPGAEEFVAYQLSTMDLSGLTVDLDTVRREAVAAVCELPVEQRHWFPRLVIAVGHR